MEWKSNLRRTQSLRSISLSCDQPTWTGAGLRGKMTSVSQLVARYQTSVEVDTSIQETMMTPSLLESPETRLDVLIWRNEDRERSRAKTSLARSKSMGSLQTSAVSIEALKAVFESKAQNNAKSSFRALSSTSSYKSADFMPVMNGEAEEVERPAEKVKTQIPAEAPVDDAKDDHKTKRVVNQAPMERRKTIGGIDFEKIAASQDDDKRRSVADFRDSSFIQTKENLCVSVKAISALYLSKAAPQDPTNGLLKTAQDQSSEIGKRAKLSKMAEDSQQIKDGLSPPPSTRNQPGSEDISGAHFQQAVPSQLTKEKLYQQRQKCELRRLLKHTHPELKMLDDVVDEELAEVLSSETGATTGETGYEGEVLSRCLIFENCSLSDKVSPYIPKRHMAEGTVERGDVSKISAQERPLSESVKEMVEDDKTLVCSPDPNTECEEDMVRIDVQATRRLFESQSVNTSRLNPDIKPWGKASISGDEPGAVQKRIQEHLHSKNKSNACAKSLDLTDLPQKKEPCAGIIGQSTDRDVPDREEFSTGEGFEDEPTSLCDPEKIEEIIKTSPALLKNNPFIQTNIEREHSFMRTSESQSPVRDSAAAQDYPIANVKNRAHLFESMPFDKIRHQNKDEVETMVENIKDTLNSLYHVNVIHSGGLIIEVYETMIARKAKFTLSEVGPEIKYDEVAEGGAQNFILQLLPRTNRKPQITYLKEDSKGRMEATVVNVPVHHHQFTTNQDTEFKTANVVQVVEDILNQDNSLRKGVVIQEDVNRCAEVIVYSLYNYFDDEDVKSYCPPQGAEYEEPESDRGNVSKTDDHGLRKGAVESTISCLLDMSKDQNCQGLIRPVRDSAAAQDYPIANVKNRAHLFESMPFDKIRHQNKDEVETMVENIKDTLSSLYHVNVIHSGGSIIEVYETMIARKAKFTLSEGGPEIKYDEVAEGGAQNFILQLLPRTNRKPQITYLKEDSKRRMEATVVNVPVHHDQFTTNQDTEFKTANVVQVVEDILNQDNSLRKGVVIQEDVNRCAEVIVYSLYNYFDDEDVKSYCPPQGAEYEEPESDRGNVSRTDDHGLRKGAVESTISCLLDMSKDQICQGLIRPEITVKGNVNLFKSCIEKGDLEYLKSLQAEPEELEQELPTNQDVAGQGMELHPEQRDDQAEASDWVPVDVKKLKNMFSGDQKPVGPKPNVYKNLAQSTTSSCTFTSHNEPPGKSKSSTDCNVEVFSHGQLKNTFDECGPQTQKEACKSSVEPQESFLEMQEDGTVHWAEIIEVVDGNYEISNLQTAIHSLQQATIEAKALYHSSQEKQKLLVQESSKEPVVSVTDGNVRHSRTQGQVPQENANKKEDPCMASNITSEHKSDRGFKSTVICDEDTNPEMCSKMCQKGTEVVQKPATASVHSSETTAAQQEDEEVVFQGKLQAALNSLERSNINVSRGDFRAAMIYRNSSKPHKEMPQNVDEASVQKRTTEEFCPVAEPKSTQPPIRQEVSKEQVTAATADPPSQSGTQNRAATSAISESCGRSVRPKPAIPPKPEHLKVKQGDIQSTNAKSPEITPKNTPRPEEIVPQPLPMTSLSSKDEQDLIKINSNANSGTESVDLQRNKLCDEAVPKFQENEVRHQVQGSLVTLERDNSVKNIIHRHQEINVTAEDKSSQESSIKENMSKTDQSHVDFHQECKTFGGKKAVKNTPVKPKRVKIAQPDNKYPNHMSGDNNSSILTHVEQPQEILTGPSCNNTNTCRQTADSKDKHEKETKQEGKVEMREKKGRTETEDERRQRLSVHMDEIMRGNITAAMEIFDNLRKQEELQSILCRVEEIEQDTSEVDVRSLRRVFENVPDWVVSADKKKHKQVKVENKEERMLLTRHSTENKPSMAHVFGDLERASEEIINLKEQTLARLMDIEGAIKKALYSVSTLKSDSDIVGLSCLFKESLGTAQESPSSGNISKISIGSSRKKSLLTQERPTAQVDTALPVSQSACIEVASAKQRASPPSSPAFISIQSAARKTDKTELLPTAICPTCQHSPKTDEKFRTTKTLTCNSPAQNRKVDPRKGGQKQSSYSPLNPKRELSVLEVQTDPEGNSVMDTKTVTENYERSDNFGNRVFSSKTSTVVTTQPETTTSKGQAVVSPATYQVTSYPEVRLPINQKP